MSKPLIFPIQTQDQDETRNSLHTAEYRQYHRTLHLRDSKSTRNVSILALLVTLAAVVVLCAFRGGALQGCLGASKQKKASLDDDDEARLSSFEAKTEVVPPSNLTCDDDDYDYIPNNIEIPSFLIIGAQKCGTTALSQIIHKYTDAIRTNTFEGQWFLPEMRERIHTDKEACELRREYVREKFDVNKILQQAKNKTKGEKIITYDKTPRYVAMPGLAEVVHRLFSGRKNFRVMALVRNPVSRAYSKFLHAMRSKGQSETLPQALDDYIMFDYRAMRVANLTSAPSLEEYHESIRRGRKLGDDAFALRGESFQERANRVLKYKPVEKHQHHHLYSENLFYKGMYAQQLAEWTQYFELGKNLMVVQYEKLNADKAGIFKEMLNFLGLPTTEEMDFEHNYYERQPVTDPKQLLSNTTKDYLQRFFKPYNDELADLLGEDWRGIWD